MHSRGGTPPGNTPPPPHRPPPGLNVPLPLRYGDEAHQGRDDSPSRAPGRDERALEGAKILNLSIRALIVRLPDTVQVRKAMDMGRARSASLAEVAPQIWIRMPPRGDRCGPDDRAVPAYPRDRDLLHEARSGQADVALPLSRRQRGSAG